jgi:hypothetical protein
MSAAVWNEPQDPELRCRDVRRTAGASRDTEWNTSVLIICAPRQRADARVPRPPRTSAVARAAEPRPAETTA